TTTRARRPSGSSRSTPASGSRSARPRRRSERARKGGLDSERMALRICLVTPFAWSQPHDVNDHVAGVAAELRQLGHSVTVLAPSNRAADLRAGRRALLRGESAEVVALGPALPISRLS